MRSFGISLKIVNVNAKLGINYNISSVNNTVRISLLYLNHNQALICASEFSFKLNDLFAPYLRRRSHEKSIDEVHSY